MLAILLFECAQIVRTGRTVSRHSFQYSLLNMFTTLKPCKESDVIEEENLEESGKEDTQVTEQDPDDID